MSVKSKTAARKTRRTQKVAGAPFDVIGVPLPRGSAERADFWRRVERDYGCGRYTDAEIVERYAAEGLTYAGLRSKIRNERRRHGPGAWAQDLSKEVSNATKAILAQQQTIEAGGRAETVLAEARRVAGVLTRHRADSLEARDAVMETLAEVRRAAVKRDDWEKMLEAASADLTAEARAALRQQLKQALALHSRASSLHKLVDAIAKAQERERKAWHIPEEAPAGQSPFDSMDDAQVMAELGRLQGQMAALGIAVGQLQGMPPLPPPPMRHQDTTGSVSVPRIAPPDRGRH